MTKIQERVRVAIVIPCLDEALSIGKVVDDFKAVLPEARIVVVDNDSRDDTARIAAEHGAVTVRETRRGKGFALLTGIRVAAPADIFVMVDGDDTYPAESVVALIESIENGADMAIGTRMSGAGDKAFPVGHTFGNRLFIWVVRVLFGIETLDLFSGYRALTERFLEQSPLIAQGFEIEAELSIQAFTGRFRVDEIPIQYRQRPEHSASKLRTFRDGYRILISILAFFRDYRPLTSFGTLALVLLIASVSTGGLVVKEFLATGQILRIPMAILAAGIFVLSALSLTAGVILSSINRRTEELRALLLLRRK